MKFASLFWLAQHSLFLTIISLSQAFVKKETIEIPGSIYDTVLYLSTLIYFRVLVSRPVKS